MSLLLIPLLCFLILVLWTWALCNVLIQEQSLYWLVLLVFLPPLAIPLYLINFYILGDERAGVGYMIRIAKRRAEIARLEAEQIESSLVGRSERLAQLYMEEGKPEQALRELQSVLDHDPEDVAAQYLAARALTKLGNVDNALAHADYVYTERPAFDDYRIAVLYGDLLERSGRRREAERIYRETLDRRMVPAVAANLALLYNAENRIDDAAATLEALAQFAKDSSGVVRRDAEAQLRRARSGLGR